MASSKNSSNMTNRLILVVAGMLVLSALAYFSIKYFSEKSLNQKKGDQISELSTEILDLEEKIFDLNNNLEEKDMDLAAKEKKVEDNKTQIKDLLARLNTAKQKDKTQTDLIRGYENRLKELEGLLDNYQNQIAFLKDQNLLLTGQVDSLQVTQIRLQEEYLTLKASNDESIEELAATVQKASVLSAANYKFFSVSKKGKAKEEVEFRRRSLKDLKICFTVLGNQVAKSGLRDIYLVMKGPDGSQKTNFGEGFSGTFTSDGQEMSYTAKALLDYNRTSQQVCVDFTPEVGTKYDKGTYNVQVFTEGRQIGKSEFVVR